MAPFDTLKNLWSIRDYFNDVTISCKNNQTLKAHKVVLSAASKHLHDHCTNNDVINLAEISLEVVEHLLEFIYTGNPPTDDNHLKQDNLDEDRLASLIEIHGRTLKRLDCPKWKMSPYFASNHLAPGSSFRNLENLTFDGSENSNGRFG